MRMKEKTEIKVQLILVGEFLCVLSCVSTVNLIAHYITEIQLSLSLSLSLSLAAITPGVMCGPKATYT